MSKSIILLVIIFILVIGGIVYVMNTKQQKSGAIQPSVTAISQEPSPIQEHTAQNNASVSAAVTQAQSPSPSIAIVQNATQAVIHTGKGNITIQLYPQDAPKTVANFATLSE